MISLANGMLSDSNQANAFDSPVADKIFEIVGIP